MEKVLLYSMNSSHLSLLLLSLCPLLAEALAPPEEGLDDLVVEDEEDDAGDVEGGQRRQDDEVGVVELALRHLRKMNDRRKQVCASLRVYQAVTTNSHNHVQTIFILSVLKELSVTAEKLSSKKLFILFKS